MGLDTFPLLQDQTYLFIYKNTVFKLKLEYQPVSQQMKETFVQVVSERTAHCQIEDVCRALLYNIEREEPISPIQSEHFVIYPEVHRWQLANKVQFFVHGKQLSCHRDLILLKLCCKDMSLYVPNQNKVKTSSSSFNKTISPRHSHDTSQLKPRSENFDKRNASTSCSGVININNKKSSSEVVSGTTYKTSVCGTSNARPANNVENVSLESSDTATLVPQQHYSQSSSCASSGDQYSSHVETSNPGTSVEIEKDVGNVSSGKSKHKKTMEPSQVVRYDHNFSRKIKHQVNEISQDISRQSTQQTCNMLKNQTTLQTEQAPQSEIPHKNSKTMCLCSTDVQTCQDVCAPQTPGSQSAQGSEKPLVDSYEVVYERNVKVMPKRITRSELRKRFACNNSSLESFRKSKRMDMESRITRRVTSESPYTSMGRSVKACTECNGATPTSTKKYTHGRNTSVIKGGTKHTGSCDEMKSHSSSEISDADVIEISFDGRTLFKSEKKINHRRVTPVSPIVSLRSQKMKQNNSLNYSNDTNKNMARRYRSRSTENGKARRLRRQINREDIVYERKQIKGHDAVPASRNSGDSSHISVRNRRAVTKYNYSGEQRMLQNKYGDCLKKKEATEKATFDINKKLLQTTDSRRKVHSYDSMNRITRSDSASTFSGKTDMTFRSLRSARKNLPLSPLMSSNRGKYVPDALVKARQHLIAAKDGVWLF